MSRFHLSICRISSPRTGTGPWVASWPGGTRIPYRAETALVLAALYAGGHDLSIWGIISPRQLVQFWATTWGTGWAASLATDFCADMGDFLASPTPRSIWPVPIPQHGTR